MRGAFTEEQMVAMVREEMRGWGGERRVAKEIVGSGGDAVKSGGKQRRECGEEAGGR